MKRCPDAQLLPRSRCQHHPAAPCASRSLLQHKVPDKLTDPSSVSCIHSITKTIGMLVTGMHGALQGRGLVQWQPAAATWCHALAPRLRQGWLGACGTRFLLAIGHAWRDAGAGRCRTEWASGAKQSACATHARSSTSALGHGALLPPCRRLAVAGAEGARRGSRVPIQVSCSGTEEGLGKEGWWHMERESRGRPPSQQSSDPSWLAPSPLLAAGLATRCLCTTWRACWRTRRRSTRRSVSRGGG